MEEFSFTLELFNQSQERKFEQIFYYRCQPCLWIIFFPSRKSSMLNWKMLLPNWNSKHITDKIIVIVNKSKQLSSQSATKHVLELIRCFGFDEMYPDIYLIHAHYALKRWNFSCTINIYQTNQLLNSIYVQNSCIIFSISKFRHWMMRKERYAHQRKPRFIVVRMLKKKICIVFRLIIWIEHGNNYCMHIVSYDVEILYAIKTCVLGVCDRLNGPARQKDIYG